MSSCLLQMHYGSWLPSSQTSEFSNALSNLVYFLKTLGHLGIDSFKFLKNDN